MTRSSVAVWAIAAVGLLSGCVSWQPGWTDAPAVRTAEDVSERLAQAAALARDADNEAKLVEAIDAYESVLESDSSNYTALAQACQWNILKAAAYTRTRKAKRPIYRRGIRYCERAMYTNGEFSKLVDRGSSLDEAAAALTRREADAMVFWVTGVSYYFKECLGGLGKLTGVRLIRKTETLATRMAEIDPDYSNGVVHFSRGIYYLGLPEFAGGDRERSRELLGRAQAVGPESLLIRWGRAKYFHLETRNRAGFESDLRWVLAQDPHRASSPYAWNVYFQRDAAALLAEIDRLFD